jgi:glycine/D-amino acid oxidase-like deaminating enzyme
MRGPIALGPDQQASLWIATATPAPECPALDGPVDTDVCVIGGGYTGFACALALAENGADVTVLEAQGIGHGGSGRNGGQVIPGLKQDPEEILATVDRAEAERMIELAGSAADRTFALIDRHRIDCDARPGGWLQPAHCAAALKTITDRANAWSRRGAKVELLDRAQTAKAMGTPFYHGSWIDRRAGAVQPLSYTRGLAGAAIAKGARVFVHSPAQSLRREADRWWVGSARGQVRARTVVLATDAYADGLWPDLQRNFVGLNSVQIATDVLPAELRKTIIPVDLPVSETRKLVYYYRVNTDGRFIMGGRGNVEGNVPEHVFAALRMVAERLFPQLKGLHWPYRWWGQVGLTLDWLPHLAEPAPGLWSGSGYCGRGVAMATAMGQVLANRVLGGTLARSDPALEFPVKPLRRVPLWSFRKPGVATAIMWFRLREALGFPA